MGIKFINFFRSSFSIDKVSVEEPEYSLIQQVSNMDLAQNTTLDLIKIMLKEKIEM